MSDDFFEIIDRYLEGINENQKTYGKYGMRVRIVGEFKEIIKPNIRNKICQQHHVRRTITSFYKDTVEQHERIKQMVNEISV